MENKIKNVKKGKVVLFFTDIRSESYPGFVSNDRTQLAVPFIVSVNEISLMGEKVLTNSKCDPVLYKQTSVKTNFPKILVMPELIVEKYRKQFEEGKINDGDDIWVEFDDSKIPVVVSDEKGYANLFIEKPNPNSNVGKKFFVVPLYQLPNRKGFVSIKPEDEKEKIKKVPGIIKGRTKKHMISEESKRDVLDIVVKMNAYIKTLQSERRKAKITIELLKAELKNKHNQILSFKQKYKDFKGE